jgi:hypothetical protein
LGEKEILWGKRNFEDCKRIFEQAIVEALIPCTALLVDGVTFIKCPAIGSLIVIP